MSEDNQSIEQEENRTVEEDQLVEKEKRPRRKDTCLSKVKKSLSDFFEKNKGCKVAVFTHPSSDPDALGSMMGISWLLKKFYDVNVDCFYDGHISHPQNQRMCNLLDPELHLVEDFDPTQYSYRIIVDTIPAYAALPESIKPVDIDLVIDHHKDPPNGGFKGLYLNLKAGSCCATVHQLIREHGISFEDDNERDIKVATAMMIGIITDTEYQTSDDTTLYEHEAYKELFDFRSPEALKQITRYKHPKEWVQARANVAMKAHDRIKDGILIQGIGFITAGNRDLIAAVADDVLTWEGVETCVVFAVVDGSRIEGSVRSHDAALAVPSLCKELGGQFIGGSGGGKLGKGSFKYDLGNFEIKSSDGEELKSKLWEYVEYKEFQRILKIIRGED